MVLTMCLRMLRSTDARLLWNFAWNFGVKGMISVQRFKSRLKRGRYFPPFLHISILNSCNLRCQGCWVDVDAPRQMISFEKLDGLIRQARRQGNSFFGILGGEPFMHPDLMRLLAAHPECYFQIFTNGQFITPQVAAELRRLGNTTILVSIEGNSIVSDERRGRPNVYNRTLAGLRNCIDNRLITGVCTSVCQTNIDDLLTQSWLMRLVEMGVHYVWYYAYRPVGPNPNPQLALNADQLLRLRQFIVQSRKTVPIGIVDAYWDDRGRGLCPMATGISHHIGPSGGIEPCPIIQFAAETVYDDGDIAAVMARSKFLADFRELAATTTRGCIVLERPDLVKALVRKHNARDTTSRQTALAELEAMTPRISHNMPGQEVPEEHWLYRFAKKHWFFGFGAYG